MATSASIIAASQDRDLTQRAIALAAEKGIENPQYFVESNNIELATMPVGEKDKTVASIYEFAQVSYAQKYQALQDQLKDLELEKPGVNPAGVTDDYLKYALDQLIANQVA